VSYSLFRELFPARKRKSNGWVSNRRRKKEATAVSTRQWLGLSLIVSVFVGVIFILAIYFLSGK